MTKQSSSIVGVRLGAYSWPAVLIGIVAMKAAVSLAVKPRLSVAACFGISYLLLLVLATCFAIRNGVRSTAGGRLFWALLAVSSGLWAVHQGLLLYYALALRIEVPENSAADPILFLHVAVLTAAVATLPHQESSDRKPYTAILNALVVTLFWVLLYGYVVFPYQYLFSSTGSISYALRFDVVYLAENPALILMISVLLPRAKDPWRLVYLHLLGAAALYALSSTIANLAIDYLGGYANGKLYGVGLIASACWFVWIPLCHRRAARSEIVSVFNGSDHSTASLWAMLVVVAFSAAVVWELLRWNENDGLRTLRVVFAVVMIVCLASAAYVKEFMAKRELGSHFGLSNERLRLAMQTGTSMIWESDVKSGRGVWRGDLQEIFGFHSDVRAASLDEFIRCVYPEDRRLFADALEAAKKNRTVFAPEFRIVRSDGTVRWLEARGKFYYSKQGRPERMVGVSLDTTERKQAEEVLSGMTRKLLEAQDQERARIARELHDDIVQRLALIALEIDQLQDPSNDLPSQVQGRMQELHRMTFGVSASIRDLSHELHSSALEYLGLVGAMKSWCREFAARQQLEIVFESDDLQTPSQEVSLCLFRVLQEALHNAAKHSEAKRIEIRLGKGSGEIHLTIRDSGKGFEIESAMQNRGLGLRSMRERVRLVGGTIVFETKPLNGTTIHVRVPFAGGSEAA